VFEIFFAPNATMNHADKSRRLLAREAESPADRVRGGGYRIRERRASMQSSSWLLTLRSR
jgi:hypothetical protein